MIKFDPKKNHGTVHGPGADCAFIQDGVKFDGTGSPIPGQEGVDYGEEKPKKVIVKPEPVKNEEVCSYCGKSFKKLTSHLRWCKEKKKADGRNAGKPDRQIERNEPENMAPGRNQTSFIIGRRNDS